MNDGTYTKLTQLLSGRFSPTTRHFIRQCRIYIIDPFFGGETFFKKREENARRGVIGLLILF